MRVATGGGQSQHRQLIADGSDLVCIHKRTRKCATRLGLDRRRLCVRSNQRTSRSAVAHSSCHRPHAPDGRVNRYYDPATAQFVSVDPAVATTGAPYYYASDDPVNDTDPNGDICWGLCTFTNAAHYVAKHKVQIGIGLGALALAATGVGIIGDSALLAGAGVLAGAGATALDVGPCVHGGNGAACVGASFGFAATAIGTFGLGLSVWGGFEGADAAANSLAWQSLFYGAAASTADGLNWLFGGGVGSSTVPSGKSGKAATWEQSEVSPC